MVDTNDTNPTKPLRFSVRFDAASEVSLSDVGGGGLSLFVAVASIFGNDYEFFVLLDPEVESRPVKTRDLAPDHEMNELPVHYQRRVDLVTGGKHCCAGRTRSGKLCQSLVKTAGQVCRRHESSGAET